MRPLRLLGSASNQEPSWSRASTPRRPAFSTGQSQRFPREIGEVELDRVLSGQLRSDAEPDRTAAEFRGRRSTMGSVRRAPRRSRRAPPRPTARSPGEGSGRRAQLELEAPEGPAAEDVLERLASRPSPGQAERAAPEVARRRATAACSMIQAGLLSRAHQIGDLTSEGLSRHPR